jgi:hypothetical protein
MAFNQRFLNRFSFAVSKLFKVAKAVCSYFHGHPVNGPDAFSQYF